jgi:hypothetical protein
MTGSRALMSTKEELRKELQGLKQLKTSCFNVSTGAGRSLFYLLLPKPHLL